MRLSEPRFTNDPLTVFPASTVNVSLPCGKKPFSILMCKLPPRTTEPVTAIESNDVVDDRSISTDPLLIWS